MSLGAMQAAQADLESVCYLTPPPPCNPPPFPPGDSHCVGSKLRPNGQKAMTTVGQARPEPNADTAT